MPRWLEHILAGYAVVVGFFVTLWLSLLLAGKSVAIIVKWIVAIILFILVWNFSAWVFSHGPHINLPFIRP